MRKLIILAAVGIALCVCVPVAGADQPKGQVVEKDAIVGEYEGGITVQHNLGVDADANGDEIVYYDDRSSYGDEVANARQVWNALDRRFNGKGVVFQPISNAPAGARLELVFADARCESYAFYDPNRNPDRIIFCTNNMRRLNGLRQDETAAHEAGHAIGFAHPEPCRKFLGRAIMVGACGFSDSRKPLRHDIADYRNRWVD
jgi:hypothetical protein